MKFTVISGKFERSLVRLRRGGGGGGGGRCVWDRVEITRPGSSFRRTIGGVIVSVRDLLTKRADYRSVPPLGSSIVALVVGRFFAYNKIALHGNSYACLSSY